MSAQVNILVEFDGGKPHLALGYYTQKTRAFTRKGDAVNFRRDGVPHGTKRDIRILTVTIPDDGPVGDGIWPELVPEVAVEWS
ncbi:hypothetical protein FDH96_gp011 [Mycobacterium phage Rey]|uniref:Uncharacterized protein n=1 Tax=Mycobacterium phage Rey TaxID=1034115 RepID=G1D573_9CAUD|nr:hypothetical protein FDH96_gp011 [Mycobacterium phage Rey]AEK09923.1 hypothetical protein PBI_REY_11 [Mycobacterium phage Rey]